MAYPVSQRFLDAIPYPHRLLTTCTVTPYGASSITFRVSSGSVTADRSQRIRRTATITIDGGSTNLYNLLSQPGTTVAVDHGFLYGGTDQELIPQIRAELTSAALPLGAGAVQVSLADYWQRLAAVEYINPYTPTTTNTRVAEITAAVQQAFPSITVTNLATDTGVVGTSQAWTSRADMIGSFATDGGMEGYFAGNGAFVLRDVPKITGNVAYLIKTGRGGTLGGLTRNRPLDKLYNTVILTPATADSAQNWTQVVAQITDTNDPRHPNRIGPRPYRYQSPTLLTDTDAATVAAQLLAKVTGTTETLSLDALANPALEPGDIVRVQTPIDGGTDIVNHFLEQVSTDFTSGGMTANTRNDTEAN